MNIFSWICLIWLAFWIDQRWKKLTEWKHKMFILIPGRRKPISFRKHFKHFLLKYIMTDIIKFKCNESINTHTALIGCIISIARTNGEYRNFEFFNRLNWNWLNLKCKFMERTVNDILNKNQISFQKIFLNMLFIPFQTRIVVKRILLYRFVSFFLSLNIEWISEITKLG